MGGPAGDAEIDVTVGVEQGDPASFASAAVACVVSH